MFIFYDTETSDKWNFKGAWNAEEQPHLVQLGYQIYDKDRNLIKEVDTVVDSRQITGWEGMNPEAAAVHGITEERMASEGRHPEFVAADMFDDFRSARFTIAHNNQFDMQVLNLFMFRTGYRPGLFDASTNLCTMKPLTNILKIKGKYGYKWPSLQEAYCNVVDQKGFVGAHDAMTDVRACRDIFWKTLDAGVVPEYKVVQEALNA